MEGSLRRRERARRVVGLSSAVFLLGSFAVQSPPAPRPVDFAREVKPIFDAHCVSCHGPKKQKGDYRVDTYERALEGSPGGKSILPGNAAASDFYRRLVTDDAEERMPQKQPPLPSAEIGILRRWIDEGAKPAAPSPVSDHWADAPLLEPEPPAVKDRAWIRNPVDRFVLAKLEAEGAPPSPEAPRGKLLRRARLDLTGVPPTAAELDVFEKDASADAYEREVERLLASKPFAERLAAAGGLSTGSPEDPRNARLAANRAWALLFGEGIVPAEAFGEHGARPSNPGLLDWLALDVVRSGGSERELVRRIATSSTYRRSVRRPFTLEAFVRKRQLLALASLPEPGPASAEELLEASAAAFAQRLVAEGGDTAESRIRLGFRLCTGRWPEPAEAAPLVERAAGGTDGLRRAAEALLRMGETTTRD